MHKNRPLAVLLSALLILSLGCSVVGQLFNGEGSGKGAVSAAPPLLPAPPKPAAAPQGNPDEQAASFAEQLASGDNRLAEWMGLYDALGVPVIGEDGGPLGSTGDDPLGPRFWQVWYSSGLDLPGRGIPLQDAGRLFAAGLPGVDGAQVGSSLLDDLRLAAQSNDPPVRLMGQFVRERILRGPSHVDILDVAATPDLAAIDLPTMQLLGWLIVRSALFQAASQASVAGDSLTFAAYHPRPAAQAGPQANCSDLPGAGSTPVAIANWVINKIGGGFQIPGMTKAFPSLVERVFGKALRRGSEKQIEWMTNLSGQALGFANVLTSAVSAIMQFEAMTINTNIDPNPLVRTHDDKYDGEAGVITLELFSDPHSLPDGDKLASCMASFFLNALGVSFSFPSKAPVPGAEIQVEGGMGFPDLVLFDINGKTGSAQTMRASTGSDGKATFNVLGRHQRKLVPDSAKPVMKEFSIVVSAQPEEAGVSTMVNVFFDGISTLSGGGAAAFLGGLIDVLKTFHYDMGEQVYNLTDWANAGWKIEGWTSSVSGVLMTGGLSCDSPYGPWEFKAEHSSPAGTTSASESIPFSEDGKATSTHEEHTRSGSGVTVDAVGTSHVTITPNVGGYQINFGATDVTTTACALGVCETRQYVKPSWVMTIVPAEPGECGQP